jgi:dTDP-4-amino-4,6-dideoxygalactose transaminase
LKTVLAPRASTILYNVLVSQRQAKPWLLPANICPIVPITFMKAKVPFELVDISSTSLHIDLDQAEARMKKREIGGVLYAHTYGEESTPDDFFTRAKSLNPDLLVVDDRCLCIPTVETKSSADVVLFSTGYAKIVELNLCGYAFMKDDVKYESAPLKFDPARHEELEMDYKAAVRSRDRFDYRDSDWLQAETELPEWETYRRMVEVGLELSLLQKRRLNAIYTTRLPMEIQLREQYQTWRFNIRVKNKKQIMDAVVANGLFASSHYASLAGIMSEGRAPVAESLAGEVVNLFNDHHCDDDRAERMTGLILRTLA